MCKIQQKEMKMRTVKNSFIIRHINSFFVGIFESAKSLLWIFNNKNRTEKYVLVISHVLDESGAPLVLWEAIKVLRKAGYKVVVVSPHVGKLRDIIRKNDGIALCCKRFKFLLRKIILSCEWKAVFVNTIQMYQWVIDSKVNTPVFWWIHEGITYADKFPTNVIKTKNFRIAFVSEWSKKCILHTDLKNSQSTILYYGIQDMHLNNKMKRDNDFLCFALIGSICDRKGVLEYLNAIDMLPPEVRKICRFKLIGKPLPTEVEYAKKVDEKIKSMSVKIERQDYIPHDMIVDMYNDIDILVCTSKDDPLPVVVTEALMFEKCVLISDHIGQYYLIRDGENGFTYKSGDVDELNHQMNRIVLMRDKLPSIMSEGRNIYNEHFNIEKFSDRLIHEFELLIQ